MGNFWDYSLAVYERPGFAPAALGLQGRLGADVNMLLYCCWYGASGRGTLTPNDLAVLAEKVHDWRVGVIEPLRAVRRRMKPDRRPEAMALRAKINACELDAERIEQSVLADEACLPDGAPQTAAGKRDDAGRNLDAYFLMVGAALMEADRADIARLLDAAFPI